MKMFDSSVLRFLNSWFILEMEGGWTLDPLLKACSKLVAEEPKFVNAADVLRV